MQCFNYHIPYHPFNYASDDIRYLPVEDCDALYEANKGDFITLFGPDTEGRVSRIGSCVVNGAPAKYSELPDEMKKFCFKTNFKQLPVHIIHARGFGMDIRLMQFAGFYMSIIPFKPCQFIRSFGYDFQRKKLGIYERFWYIWNFCFDTTVVEQYRQLVVHLYRDEMMNDYNTYKRFMYQKELKCEKCGMTLQQETLGTNRFFELHDTETNIMRPFRKIDKSKIMVVCPSCHTLLHNATIPEDVTDNEKWSHGFNSYGQEFSGWSEYLVEKFKKDFPELSPEYKKRKKPFDTYTFFPNQKPHRRSAQDIYALFNGTSDRCVPLDSSENLFAIYNSKNREYLIIDRFLQNVFPDKIHDLKVCKDKFVVIEFAKNYNTVIYTPDCKTILWNQHDKEEKARANGRQFYTIHGITCDDEGRLYYAQTKAGKEDGLDPFFYNNLRYGCQTIDDTIIIPFEYKSIEHFDSKGFAVTKKGSKYGCIDKLNKVLIPFDYTSFYRNFDNHELTDIAIVTQKKEKEEQFMYLTRKNEIVGTFMDNKIGEKGFHIYEHNGLYGLAKQFGTPVTKPQYKSITILDDGNAKLIDNQGNEEIVKYE